MATLNPREEIVCLMRGFFACPLIAALGKRGVCARFLEGPFQTSDFPQIADEKLFGFVLTYLVSLDLLAEHKQNGNSVYKLTELGSKIFRRYGAFVLLHSYRDLIEHMDALLFEQGATKPLCDRRDNVVGSGLTNGRKYFPKAIEMLRAVNLGLIVDVACGDGSFLSSIISNFPDVEVVAFDLSEIAIKKTVKNLRKRFPNKQIETVITDALDVKSWAPAVAARAKKCKGETVISMWYLIHEISRHNADLVVRFLGQIHAICPAAHLIVGEIVNVPDNVLAPKRHETVMPEFLLFHNISGQGVLTWEQFQYILSKIPYRLEQEARFDIIKNKDVELPTGLVWHLSPRDTL